RSLRLAGHRPRRSRHPRAHTRRHGRGVPPGPRPRGFAMTRAHGQRRDRRSPLDALSAGSGLAEVVVALSLCAALAAAAGAALFNTLRVARTVAARTDALDAARTVAAVLRTDVAAIAPGDAAFGGDSIRVRVFRGIGLACDTAAGAVLVRFRGARLPAPDKGSVLVLARDNEAALVLAAGSDATGGTAAPGERVSRLASHAWAAGPPAAGTPILIFETGTYAIADRAFRYRRG